MIRRYEQSRPRSKQHNIGPSEIGTECSRQLAYKLRDTPKLPDGNVPWPTFQGSAIHEGMANVLDYWNRELGRRRFIIENRVFASERINGKGDALDTDTHTVIDWKYVGLSTIEALSLHGRLAARYPVQAQCYARGYQLVGYDVRNVLIVLLARDSRFSQSVEWSAPYDQSVAEEAISRERTLARILASSKITTYSIPASPGAECRWCDWYRPGVPSDAAGCSGGSELGPPSTASLLRGRS